MDGLSKFALIGAFLCAPAVAFIVGSAIATGAYSGVCGVRFSDAGAYSVPLLRQSRVCSLVVDHDWNFNEDRFDEISLSRCWEPT